ncbi:MAG TPA: hypothetical protein VFI43_05210 [Nitrosospira sp.]|nr:hypothetical protein [Nitrosospira sp.]
MSYMCSVSVLRPVLLAGLLTCVSFVHAQATGPAGGVQSGMSGAQSAQGPALAGQGSSAGGSRATTGAMPEGAGASTEKGTSRNIGLSGDYSKPRVSGSAGMGSDESRGASTPGTGVGSVGF